jgi:hypothetical protein
MKYNHAVRRCCLCGGEIILASREANKEGKPNE